jgi:hypothetical protein
LEDRWLPSTLVVLNNLDSGAGSLRAEIAAAHQNDTIIFAPNLADQTITLTSGELFIKHNLTIVGPGAGSLTVSGNRASRVFEVANAANVTLSGLTISNGAAGSGTYTSGGGIFSLGTLTVTGCTLSGNSTTYGGGIANFGTLTVSGSTLFGNSASQGGGGIYNAGTATVIGSTLSGNSAFEGGGISIGVYGTVTIQNDSLITGNTAPLGFGADVYNQGVLYLDSTSMIGILDGNPARKPKT